MVVIKTTVGKVVSLADPVTAHKTFPIRTTRLPEETKECQPGISSGIKEHANAISSLVGPRAVMPGMSGTLGVRCPARRAGEALKGERRKGGIRTLKRERLARLRYVSLTVNGLQE